MSGKKSHFSVAECVELIFAKAVVGRIFDLRENGGNGTVISLPTSRHNPPQPRSHVLCALLPYFSPISPHFAHFTHFTPFFSLLPLFPDFSTFDSKILI